VEIQKRGGRPGIGEIRGEGNMGGKEVKLPQSNSEHRPVGEGPSPTPNPIRDPESCGSGEGIKKSNERFKLKYASDHRRIVKEESDIPRGKFTYMEKSQ